MDEKADLYQDIAIKAKELKSLYSSTASDRRELLNHLDINNWYGLLSRREVENFLKGDSNLSVSKARKVVGILTPWLQAYKRTDKERLYVLLEYGKGKLPLTASDYGEFIKQKSFEEQSASWILLDYLIGELPSELRLLKGNQLDRFAEKMYSELPLTAVSLFTEFLEYENKKAKTQNWRYKEQRGKVHRNSTAYSLQDFSRMAYCLFNEDFCKEHELVEKACSSYKWANLWLYLAVHFFSGLRTTDIVRLPMPELLTDGSTLRILVRDNKEPDLRYLIRDMQTRIRFKPMQPNKTRSHKNVPDIKFIVPASLEKPISRILAITVSFLDGNKPGEPFIRASTRIGDIREMFGEEFAIALGGINFSSRRANKAYLQGLEYVTDQYVSDGPKGYMIAALARSHKGGIGRFPGATEIYLKDARFTGYTPEFIIREMFERGVFGFIPHVLLCAAFENDYEKLSVTNQTSLVQSIGLLPVEIERLVQMIQKKLLQARETVREMVMSQDKEAGILQRIASGTASSKDPDGLCLSVACGRGCLHPEYKACFGCKYEVYTKAIIHRLMKEYRRLSQPAGKNQDHYQAILREAVLPVIAEYIYTVPKLYPQADMDEIGGIMEAFLNGSLYGSHENSNREIRQVSDRRSS